MKEDLLMTYLVSICYVTHEKVGYITIILHLVRVCSVSFFRYYKKLERHDSWSRVKQSKVERERLLMKNRKIFTFGDKFKNEKMSRSFRIVINEIL